MAALLVALAVMAVLMSVAMPVWRQEAQREKEAELVFRGEQYARAIALYRTKNSTGRERASAQHRRARRRDGYLRKKYKDPMTKDGEFSDHRSRRQPQPGQPGVRPAPGAAAHRRPQPPQRRRSTAAASPGWLAASCGVRSKSTGNVDPNIPRRRLATTSGSSCSSTGRGRGGVSGGGDPAADGATRPDPRRGPNAGQPVPAAPADRVLVGVGAGSRRPPAGNPPRGGGAPGSRSRPALPPSGPAVEARTRRQSLRSRLVFRRASTAAGRNILDRSVKLRDDRVVEPRPDLLICVVLARRMHAVGQQHHVEVPLPVDPERRAGEARCDRSRSATCSVPHDDVGSIVSQPSARELPGTSRASR